METLTVSSTFQHHPKVLAEPMIPHHIEGKEVKPNAEVDYFCTEIPLDQLALLLRREYVPPT